MIYNDLYLDVLFIFGFLIVFFISLRLFRLAGFSFLRPSLPMLFIFFFYIFSYLGNPLLFFGFLAHKGYNDKGTLFEIFLYSSLSLITILITWFLLRIGSLRFRKTIKHDGRNGKNVHNFPKKRLLLILLFTIISILLLISIQENTLPILARLKGVSTVSIANLRSQWDYSFKGKVELYRLLVFELLPYISLVLLSFSLYSHDFGKVISFLLVGITTAFLLLSNLHRFPILKFFLSIVFLSFYIQGSSLRSSIRAILVGSGIVGFVYIYLYNIRPWRALLSIFRRALTGELASSYGYIRMFPDFHDYLLGNTFPNPFGLFPWVPYPLTVEVQRFTNKHVLNKHIEIAGSQNAPFWAEGYANFGPIGVFIFSVAVGVIFFSIWELFKRIPRNPINDALATYTSFYFSNIAYSLLLPKFFPLSLFFILFITMVLKLRYYRQKSGTIQIEFAGF